MLDVIADHIKSRRHKLRKHVLFIGSSVNIPPNDVAASALLEQLASEQVGRSFQELAVERRGTAALEQFASQTPDHAQRCEALQEKLADSRPAEGHVQLARLVKDGYFSTIFTMEPDNLLAQALSTQHLEREADYHLLVAGVDSPVTIGSALKESTRLVIVKCGGDLESKYLPLIADEIRDGLQPVAEMIADAFGVVAIFTAYADRDRPFLGCVPREGGKIFWVNVLVPVSDEQRYTELKLESPGSVEYHRLQPEVVELLRARQSARHMLVREAGSFNQFFGKMGDWFERRRTSRAPRRKELTMLRGGPYRFLDYFDVQDSGFFFGRSEEISELIDLVRCQPLVVLFGRTGIGKTSLIKAGVMARLLGLDKEDKGDDDESWLPAYARCEDDPTASIRLTVTEAAAEAGYQLPSELSSAPLGELLSQTAGITGHRVVVFLDQFEEFFVKLGQKMREEFVSQVQEHLEADPSHAHLVLSVREDFVGELYELHDRLPEIMHHMYRLRKLRQEQARNAILKPAVNFGIQVERDLVDRIVEDLSRDGVAPAQLQIVCHRLYTALPQGSHTITQYTYQRLGGAEKILADYLDDALSQLPLVERRIARSILTEMAASSELKATRPAQRIGQAVGQSQEIVERVLAKLVDYRLLRTVGRGEHRSYELVHEYLLEKLADWMSQQEIELKDVQDLLTRELNNFQKLGLLMGPEELHIIGEHRRELRISPEELELIIRSAAGHHVDTEYWCSRAAELGPVRHAVLASLLTDPAETVRRTAYEHVGKHLHRDLIAALVRGLDDELPQIRRQAREYLQVMESELTRLLHTDCREQRQLAAAGLGQIGGRRSEQVLIEALSDEDDPLTETITDSLRHLGDEHSAQVLLRRVMTQADAAWASAYALGQLSASEKAVSKLMNAAQGPRANVPLVYALGVAQSAHHEFDAAEASLRQAMQSTTSPEGRTYVQRALEQVKSGRAQAAIGSDRWLMFGGDAAHTGYVAQTLRPPLKQIWSTRTGAVIVASPVIADGVIYIGSRDQNFYALDSQRGTVRFKFPTESRLEGSAAVVGDLVIFGSTDGNLYALHIASGRQHWCRQLAGPIRSAVNAADSKILVGDEAGTLWAIDADSGQTIWQMSAEDQILAAPAVADGVVVVGSWDSHLYARQLADGEPCWRIDTNGPISSSPAISEGTVFCGSDDAMAYAIDLASGQITWQTPLGGRIRAAPAVANDRLVVGCTDGSVYCLDKVSGEIVWRTETAEEVLAAAVITGEVAYIGSKDGTLYGLDLATGESRWQYRTAYGIYSSPAVAEGILYIGIAYYYVAAFGES